MNLPECPTCHGSGQIYWGVASNMCDNCHGRGRLLPPEALQAAAKAIADDNARHGYVEFWVDATETERLDWQAEAEVAIFAFIDALPGDTK